MKNLLLLSGMDGTGILFRPLLDELNQSDVNYRIAIYDFNACRFISSVGFWHVRLYWQKLDFSSILRGRDCYQINYWDFYYFVIGQMRN